MAAIGWRLRQNGDASRSRTCRFWRSNWTGVATAGSNVDEVVTACPDHPIRVCHDALTLEPTAYILVRPGVGVHGIEARINRATYYELVALAVPEWVDCRRMLGIWSCNHFFPLGELPIDEPEAPADRTEGLERAVQRFSETSMAVATAFDEVIQSARGDNNEIQAINERIQSHLAGTDARQAD